MSAHPFTLEFDNDTTTRLGIFPMLAIYLQEIVLVKSMLQ